LESGEGKSAGGIIECGEGGRGGQGVAVEKPNNLPGENKENEVDLSFGRCRKRRLTRKRDISSTRKWWGITRAA
jgi:hypothetical protein